MENKNLEKNIAQEEKGLSIKELLGIVRKHIIAIIIFVVAFSVAGFGLATYKDNKSPSYTATATVYIGTGYGETDLQPNVQYQLARYLIPTFIGITKSNTVLERVEKDETVPYTVSQLKSRITINSDDSLIVSIGFRAGDKETAATVANVIVKKVIEYVQTELSDSDLLTMGLRPLDEASPDRAPKASSKMKYTVVFFAIGFVCAVAYVSLREIFDNSFKSSEQVEEELGLRVLASIPLYEINEDASATK